MSISSSLVEDAVASFASLPGIGKKTALRLVIHLINKDKSDVNSRFLQPIADLIDQIQFCKTCHNISDTDQCSICGNSHRNQKLICVVENIRDVIAIEDQRGDWFAKANAQAFEGLDRCGLGQVRPLRHLQRDVRN